jgi:hypothetical protein
MIIPVPKADKEQVLRLAKAVLAAQLPVARHPMVKTLHNTVLAVAAPDLLTELAR